MKIKIFALNIFLHSLILHSSEPKDLKITRITSHNFKAYLADRTKSRYPKSYIRLHQSWLKNILYGYNYSPNPNNPDEATVLEHLQKTCASYDDLLSERYHQKITIDTHFVNSFIKPYYDTIKALTLIFQQKNQEIADQRLLIDQALTTKINIKTDEALTRRKLNNAAIEDTNLLKINEFLRFAFNSKNEPTT